MKRIVFLFCIFFSLGNVIIAQEAFDKAPDFIADSTAEQPFFLLAEQMPQFPGGMDGLSKYLSETIVYPPTAAENGVTGKVYVSFIVNEDGSVDNIEILRGVEPAINTEAIRVISLMPKWIPGMQGGKNVKVKYTLPINFRLNIEEAEKSKK